VYYSGYVPVLEDKRLPSLTTEVPMLRENRLYQSDWLMRFYGFKAEEF
jgi:predicted DNA-binding helix-hairpin-helix protein